VANEFTTLGVNVAPGTNQYPALVDPDAAATPNQAVPAKTVFKKGSPLTYTDAGTRTATVVLSAVVVAGAANSGAPASGTSSGAGYYTPDPHCTKLLVTLRSVYGTAITAAPTLNAFTSPDAGTSWDTDAFATGSVSYAVSTTKQATIVLNPATAAASVLYFQVVNNDATTADNITVTVTVQEVDG